MKDQRGQSLVEFALVGPLFFLLIFGVIQLGILFGGQVGLTNATREVARYASVMAGDQSAAITGGAGEAQKVMRRSIPAFNSTAATTTVSYCYYPNPTTPVTYSRKVSISIQYGHSLFIPLVGGLIDRFDGVADNRYTVTAKEEMKVETQPVTSVPVGATMCGVNP